MLNGHSHTTLRHAALAVLALVSASCVKDRIVYRDLPDYNDPPAAAASFVGYARENTKQTACGNCHIDTQTEWVETAHADAWNSLQSSGHAADYCEACHTVSHLGNAGTEPNVAFAATNDKRYHDVQCESCHGAGLAHIKGPTSSNWPLASIRSDTGMVLGTGCGECHNGTHHPYVEEWRSSAHGTTPNLAYTAPRGESCTVCHSAQAALKSFGVTANYIEKNAAPMGITCVVCHDPHAKNEEGQLRFSLTEPNEEGNLCMRCHHKRGVPDMTAQSRGPHSPEGPTLLGYAGWFPPGMNLPDTIFATHGSERNPRLCAGCHVQRTTVTDPATGNFVFQGTGHGFNAIPCLDATGKPTQGTCTISQRTFRACTGSGCHASENVARSAMITAELRIDELADELKALLLQVPAGQAVQDGTYTTYEGALFNLGMVRRNPLTATPIPLPGQIIHNPFLVEALLTASIRQVRQDYGLAAVNTSLNLNNILQQR